MVFNWFKRKFADGGETETPESEVVPTEDAAVEESDTGSGDDADSSSAEDYLAWAKTAYKNGTTIRNEVKNARKNFKGKLAIRLKTPYGVIQDLKKGVLYVRYADNWILTLTCTKKQANVIKEKIAKFLENNLKMLIYVI